MDNVCNHFSLELKMFGLICWILPLPEQRAFESFYFTLMNGRKESSTSRPESACFQFHLRESVEHFSRGEVDK